MGGEFLLVQCSAVQCSAVVIRGIRWCRGSKGKNLFLPIESLESPTLTLQARRHAPAGAKGERGRHGPPGGHNLLATNPC
jgi:hypothetical protein